MKIPNLERSNRYDAISLARIVSEDSQPEGSFGSEAIKSSKDS